MVNPSLPETARLAIRSTICPTCERRPAGSESWVAQQARPCEGGCAIFTSLNRLLGIASSHDLDGFGECEDAITDVVCPNCTVSRAPGEYCPSRVACSCPLFCSSVRVLEVLEKIVRHKPRTKVIAPKPKPREIDQAR
jgi:hypothetical protein